MFVHYLSIPVCTFQGIYNKKKWKVEIKYAIEKGFSFVQVNV